LSVDTESYNPGITIGFHIDFIIDLTRILVLSLECDMNLPFLTWLDRLLWEGSRDATATHIVVEELEGSITYISESEYSSPCTGAFRECPDMGRG